MRITPRHAALAAAATLAASVAACGRPPGQIVDLTSGPAPSGATYQPLPAASPSPSPAPPGGGVSHSVLHAIFDQLNANTAETARGEYLILDALASTIRDQIDGLLERRH